jgi:hypothetical protein
VWHDKDGGGISPPRAGRCGGSGLAGGVSMMGTASSLPSPSPPHPPQPCCHVQRWARHGTVLARCVQSFPSSLPVVAHTHRITKAVI